MVKRVSHSLALALLLTASLAPAIHGFTTHASRGAATVAVTGGDPEPIEPGVAHTMLAMLGLA